MFSRRNFLSAALTLSLLFCNALTPAHAASTKLSAAEWAELIVGNTVVDAKGKWFVYYHPDGTKIANVKGKVTKVTWRKQDNDTVCEDLVSSGKEFCHDKSIKKLTEKKDVYKMRTANGTTFKMKIEAGNSRSLK